MRFVRTTAETVGAWWGFVGEVPFLIRLAVAAGVVLGLAASWRLLRGSR